MGSQRVRHDLTTEQQQIKYLNGRGKTIKQIKVNFCDFGLGSACLDMTIKAQRETKHKQDVIKIKTFVFQSILAKKLKDNLQEERKYL